MDLARSPQELAREAAEQLRALNHRTLDPKAFEQPSDVAGVVEALTILLDRLPQALGQAAVALRSFQRHNMIRMDNGTDPTDQTHQVVGALENAQGLIEGARSALRAASPVSHMGGHWGPADETDESEAS
ncbi:hypothetical protein [Streptomyces sp. NPDC005877]|uniref:hypothetical protein n=1 Tax=Streptomyces sp. NPDC005877 TaxID=3155346 RepID=UPI003401DDBD